jgi:hypothetical protein
MPDSPLPPYVHTDWNRCDLPEIWRQIQPEDDYFTRMQERAWNRTYDLLDAHRAKLEGLFDGLAQMWPPLAGSASEAYLSELRGLIASVTQTSHDASGNALSVASIADTLMNARAKVAGLHEQTAQPYDAGKLNKEAAAIMADSDKATYDYATLLREPDLYTRGYQDRYSDPEPPRGELATDPTSPSSTETLPGDSGKTSRTDSVPPLATDARQDVRSPVLSGNPTSPTLSSSSGTDPTAIKSSINMPGGSPVTPGLISGLLAAPDMRRGPETYGNRLGKETALSQPAKQADTANKGRSSSTAGAAADGEPEHRAAVGPGAMGAAGARRQRRRRATGPAYTEWAMPKGVPAVLRPPPEPGEFHPGPGVFGIDR